MPGAASGREQTITSGSLAEILYGSNGQSSSATVTYNNLSITVNYTTHMQNGYVNCGVATATVSGTISVGGTTYTPSPDALEEALGGTGGSSSLAGC